MPLSAASRLRDRKEKALRKDDGSIEVQCGAPFEPSYIYKMLNCIQSDTFKVVGRQEDAEEFLGCLLNALNDEMLEVIVLPCTLGILHKESSIHASQNYG
jgi:ubiquitin carboxyl-terminal hydrolase 10